MIDLAKLSVDDFTPLVGEGFTVATDAGDQVLELVQARLIDTTQPSVDATSVRAPFTLLFRGPGDTILPQQMYPLDHAELGTLELFIVPVGRTEAGTDYEAVFT